MDTTFISIHDLSEEATILYSSDSVVDLLGYTPDEIVNRSAWDFFAKDEVPLARHFHQKRVASDKAAVLAYCRIKNKDGDWIGCEVCLTVVYDVMVVCTSTYKQTFKSEMRALEAPRVRRIFSSSPKDPRYHMLSHLSTKFNQSSKFQEHEPRAALFLNRFTRTLTVMYATSGLQEVIGIPAETMRGRSFYYCISEDCLKDAVKCLENAKGNDSIAYLRFWFRDPRVDDEALATDSDDSDEEMTTDTSEDGGVGLQSEHTSPDAAMEIDSDASKADSRHSSDDSTRCPDTHEAIFGQSLRAESSTSSVAMSPERDRRSPSRSEGEKIELEAVISCTSDGLVVCLRKARPMIPHPAQRPARPVFEHGMFAAPWAEQPILPPPEARAGAGFGNTFAPSLGPQGAHKAVGLSRGSNGPEQMDFMSAIRDQAIFAWALTSINGTLSLNYGQGKPIGEALPADGLPIWASDQRQSDSVGSDHCSDHGSKGNISGTDTYGRHPLDGKPTASMFGDPGLDRNGRNGGRGTGNDSGSTSNTPYPGSR